MKKIVESFCRFKNEKEIYIENRTLVLLYSAFTFVFAFITAMIYYCDTSDLLPLLFASVFIILIVVFFVWLRKSKNKSHCFYFLFQGIVTFSFSLIWVFVSFLCIFQYNLGFSFIYILGLIFGIAFNLTCVILRFLKWQKYKIGKIKEYDKTFNVKSVGILTVLLLSCTIFLNKIEKIFRYKLLCGGFIFIFFVFLTIAINMIVNYYIVKKYYK